MASPQQLQPRVGVGVIVHETSHVGSHTGRVLVGRREGSIGAGEWALPGED